MDSTGLMLDWLREEFSSRGLLVVGMQLALIPVAVGCAWLIHRYAQRVLAEHLGKHDLSNARRALLRTGLRLAFPLSTLLVVLAGIVVFRLMQYQTPVLDVLAKLLVALAMVRMVVYGLRKGFAPGPVLKAWEYVISTVVWAVVALQLLGWLTPVLNGLDTLAIEVGTSRISLLMATKLVVLSGLYLLLAFWVSGLVEQRLQRSRNINASMRVGLAKVVKFALLTLAILAALTEAGLDLASLTVFGGALGVGIGFGLQKIVSNFISGFILLGDRSIRPGDVISVGGTYGWVKQLRARYIVVRNRDGVETLIPNENLVTTDVINWSYSDRQVRVRIPVQISYHDDPEQAMAIMEKAARVNPRVLSNPEPAVRLMEFADSGIALELRVWLTDPEEGVGNVRSDINLEIWREFKKAGITIPFPQRDVHVRYVNPAPADLQAPGRPDQQGI
jgi:small-conductance mechanosensitive channel